MGNFHELCNQYLYLVKCTFKNTYVEKLQFFLSFFAVPPDPVVIFDETGKRRASVVGPYLVGDTIHLVCDAFGGKILQINFHFF